MKRRAQPPPENHERWLVSYADFITLMFAFFVVMFAASEVDKKKLARFAEAYSAYVGGRAPLSPPSDEAAPPGMSENGLLGEAGASRLDLTARELGGLQSRIEELLRELIEDDKIKVKLEGRGLILSLREAALFPPGTADFRDGSADILDKVARVVAAAGDRQIRLEGHTDDRPIRTSKFPSNWELSSARAIGVLRILADHHGLDENSISVAGYGEFRPVESNQTEEGRAANRRVDVVILAEDAAAQEPVSAVAANRP